MNEQSAESATPTPRRKKVSRVLFKYTGKEFAPESKENPAGLHKAACAWLTVLKNSAEPLDRDQCLEALAKMTDTGTSQQPIRIIYYWKKKLLDDGYIQLVRKDGQPIVTAEDVQAAPAAVAEAPAEPVAAEAAPSSTDAAQTPTV